MQAGDTISRYRIEGSLGRGGMGIVYRAEDLRLRRSVALKFLPSESITDQDKQRFLNEARAAAGARHPNICPIYDIEDEGGQLFIAMAYLDGETVHAKVAKGQLPVAEAVLIAIQVANGLQAAHDMGIIHRDIKSGNIMVDKTGHVSIMDFGLALRPDTTRLTVHGATVGTPSYMSPEQVTGGAIDARTDIWSLGVLLFEMLAGRVPFRRDHSAAVGHAILYDPAPNLHHLRQAVPPELADIVSKTLAKVPSERYQSCRELAAELSRFTGLSDPGQSSASDITRTVAFAPSTEQARTGRDEGKSASYKWVAPAIAAVLFVVAAGFAWYYRSAPREDAGAFPVAAPANPISNLSQVAILPFTVDGGTAANDSARPVADGVGEVLTTALAEVATGKYLVVPITEIRRRNITTPADARRLYGASFAVAGTAKPVADGSGRMEFAVRLVDTATGQPSAAETFLFDPADPISSRDRAVAGVSRLLHLDVTQNVQTAVRAGDSTAQGAYSLYLQARGLIGRYDIRGNQDKALSLLERAVTEDPNFALAWAAMAEAESLKVAGTGDRNWLVRAVAHAEKGVQLDSALPMVHTTLGQVYSSAGREGEAIQQFQKAIELSPGNSEAMRDLARAFANLGRFAEAEASYKKATEARPTDWYVHLLLGIFYYERERYKEAEAELQKAAELTPDNDVIYRNLGGVLTMQGRYPEAVVQYQRALKLRSHANAYAGLAAALFLQHRYAEAVSAVETAIDLDSKSFIFWGNAGIYYKWLPGSQQKSAMALRRAVELAVAYLETSPTNYDARADLAEYRARLGDSKGALSEIGKIPVSLWKPRASRLAIVYELTGRRDEALQVIAKNLTSPASLNQIRDDPDLQALWASPEMKRIAGTVAGR